MRKPLGGRRHRQNLAVVAVVTLALGGVGVMNIMLVSVNERTRAIGVLGAIGARRSHVLLNILSEGLLLTLTDGVIGVLLAIVLGRLPGTLPLLSTLEQDPAGRADIHLAISVPVLLLETAVLMMLGLTASLMPALRAAGMKPGEAIRGES